MKVLITGGAGYIGSVLTPLLLDKGYDVTVLDNFYFNQVSLLDVCKDKKLQIIKGDVRDERLMREQIAKHDALIPLACLVGAPLCDKDPEMAYAVGCKAIKHMADLKSRDQLMIYPCTNSGYGIGQQGIECDENSELRPISHYGRLKVEAESYLLERGDAVTFRFATLFGIGPRMRLDLLVNDFTYRAVNDGFIVLFEAHFKRNYLHVRDAAKAFAHTLEHYQEMQGKAHNVGLSDANLSKEELCHVIKRFVPQFHIVKSEIGKDKDQRNYIVSNKRIESTGYHPDYSLEDGVEELIKGFKIIKCNQFANI